MKILNQDEISQRIKLDADLIRTTCKFDVKEKVLNRIKNIEMVDVSTSNKPNKPFFQRMMLPMVGVTALTLIVANVMVPTVTNNAGVQIPLLQNKTIEVVQTGSASVKFDSLLEKQAIKDDILYLSQVFSM